MAYKRSVYYTRYINLGERLPACMLPDLNLNSEGEVIIHPGEVYCRYRYESGDICEMSREFISESSLRLHYMKHHQVPAEKGKSGRMSVNLSQQAYREVVDGQVPTYSPGRDTESDESQPEPTAGAALKSRTERAQRVLDRLKENVRRPQHTSSAWAEPHGDEKPTDSFNQLDHGSCSGK